MLFSRVVLFTSLLLFFAGRVTFVVPVCCCAGRAAFVRVLLLLGRSMVTPLRVVPVRVLLGRLYTLSAPVAGRMVRFDCAEFLSLRVVAPALTPDDAREGPVARGT